MPLIASAVISGVSALGKMGVSIGQIIHANKLAKNNQHPSFDIQKEYFDNRDIAARMAQHGLSEQALDYYTTANEKGLTASTGALLQGGGGINSLVSAYDQYQTGASEIAAKDAELQNKNILYYMDRNDDVAKQKVQKWVLDKYEPYKDKAAAAASEKTAGLNNLFTGLSEGASALSSYSQANDNSDLMSSIGKQQPTSTTPSFKTYSQFDDPYQVLLKQPTPAVAEKPAEDPAAQITNNMTAEDWDALKSILFKLKR